MEKVALLEPELVGAPERAVKGFGQGWREAFGSALRRPRAKPLSEELALARALDKAHLYRCLDERRWNGNVDGVAFYGYPFDPHGLG